MAGGQEEPDQMPDHLQLLLAYPRTCPHTSTPCCAVADGKERGRTCTCCGSRIGEEGSQG